MHCIKGNCKLIEILSNAILPQMTPQLKADASAFSLVVTKTWGFDADTSLKSQQMHQPVQRNFVNSMIKYFTRETPTEKCGTNGVLVDCLSAAHTSPKEGHNINGKACRMSNNCTTINPSKTFTYRETSCLRPPKSMYKALLLKLG